MVDVHTIHDTLRVFVHDTTVVRDTLVRLASPVSPWWITLKDGIGWFVTLASISVAAYLGIRGWKVTMFTAIQSQYTRKKIDDDAGVDIIKEVLLDTLWNIPTLHNIIIEGLRNQQQISPNVLALLDVAREGYDKHWDKVFLLGDKTLSRQIIKWFQEERMERILLERYARPWTDDGTMGILTKASRTSIAQLEASTAKAAALFDRLGFTRPTFDPTASSVGAGQATGAPAEP